MVSLLVGMLHAFAETTVSPTELLEGDEPAHSGTNGRPLHHPPLHACDAERRDDRGECRRRISLDTNWRLMAGCRGNSRRGEILRGQGAT